jgi:hypothetical protein
MVRSGQFVIGGSSCPVHRSGGRITQREIIVQQVKIDIPDAPSLVFIVIMSLFVDLLSGKCQTQD